MLYADRLARHGICVYEIRPGIIATDMTAAVKEKYDKMIADGLLPQARWGTPEDIGKAVVALAGGSLAYSTGQVIEVGGGLWPASAVEVIQSRLLLNALPFARQKRASCRG